MSFINENDSKIWGFLTLTDQRYANEFSGTEIEYDNNIKILYK